jgi:hypothetical protein
MLTVIVGEKKRPPGAEELAWEALTPGELGMLASTPALFGGPRVFVCAGALGGSRGEAFLDMAQALAQSPHEFIFEEEKLLKAPRTALEKAGAKIIEAKAPKKEYRFDQFGVAQALGARDRKGLWLGLTRALRAGEKPEALGGLLAWKARAMNDAALSRTITFMYHDSHRGAGELELLLERFALTL